MNVSFDELSTMAFEQRSSKPRLQTTTRTVPPAQEPQDVDELNSNALFDGNTFINPFANPSTSAAESSSSQNVDPSNMHMFYQPYPHEFKWTKDHPLEQVLGEPSRPVLTWNQLRSDGDMCMYALTVSTMKPKNVKEAMTDPAWIDSMQEELLQFKRLDVWVLVPAPDNISPLTLKWLFKNKHDEEQTVIRNKSRLVVRGYHQEEGIDFKESFTLPSATTRTVPPAQEPQDVDELNSNALFDGNTFINPFANPSTSAAESSSSQNVDPSNMHMFYQPYPHEFKWTKDHPLEQVLGEPSRPVLTWNQLRSDGDMCMYALTVSTMKPKNVKEAMTDPAWIDSMQEELLQFKRLDVWVLVPAPDNISPLTLKWLFKNKHDEEQTVIRNKSRLVVRGYHQEEGIDFKESFTLEHVEKGTIELYFVKTDYQLADLFTKALPANRFNYLVRRLGMRILSPQELERLAKSQ
nr:Gag-Pol polyprotein [Tanacetum cinerariifolium]